MRLSCLTAALVLFTSGLAAHADTLSVFTITGASQFYGMANDANTLSGMATIDTTTGVVENLALNVGGVAESGIDAQYGNELYAGLNPVRFTISGTTLVGFTGDNFNLNSPNDLYVGQVTYAGPADALAAATPEPGSLLLLGTGLLSFGAVTRRRAFRAAPFA